MYYLYIIKSIRADWFYVGSTGNLGKRLLLHNAGTVRSTKFRAPYILVYTETYPTAALARAREKEVKRSRSKKEDILRDL